MNTHIHIHVYRTTHVPDRVRWFLKCNSSKLSSKQNNNKNPHGVDNNFMNVPASAENSMELSAFIFITGLSKVKYALFTLCRTQSNTPPSGELNDKFNLITRVLMCYRIAVFWLSLSLSDEISMHRYRRNLPLVNFCSDTFFGWHLWFRTLNHVDSIVFIYTFFLHMDFVRYLMRSKCIQVVTCSYWRSRSIDWIPQNKNKWVDHICGRMWIPFEYEICAINHVSTKKNEDTVKLETKLTMISKFYIFAAKAFGLVSVKFHLKSIFFSRWNQQ